MMTAAGVFLMSWPILMTLGLLALGAWRDRRREAMVERQIRLTDAIADELGAIVAPVVMKPLCGPWRVEIQIPIGQPAAVSRIVTIAHDTLTRDGASRYELVLTPGAAPMRPVKAGTTAGSNWRRAYADPARSYRRRTAGACSRLVRSTGSFKLALTPSSTSRAPR